MISVMAAFFASGGLNAGTPSEIASMPVSAVHPLANARRTRKTISGPVSGGTSGRPGATGRLCPVRTRRTPDDQQAHAHAGEEEVRGQREDAARLADAAQVADGDQHEEDERQPDAAGRATSGKRRGDRRDAGGDADGDGQDVVERAAPPRPPGRARRRCFPWRRCRRRRRPG